MAGYPFKVLIVRPEFCPLADGLGSNQAIRVRRGDTPLAANIVDSSSVNVIRFLRQQNGEPSQGMLESPELSFGANPAERFLQHDSRYAELRVLLDETGELLGQRPGGPLPSEHNGEHGTVEDDHRFLRAAL
jgi:hypothetical protein